MIVKGRKEKNTQKRQWAAFLLILVSLTAMMAGCVVVKDDSGQHKGHYKHNKKEHKHKQ